MAEQAKNQDAPPPKDKKKLLIIVGAAVALLAVGGGAAVVLGGKGDHKAAQKVEAKADAKAEGGHGEAKPAEGGGHGEGKEGKASASSYPLEPFIVNIYDGQEIRYLKLKVEFEMANAEVKPELDAKTAALRDAILILLTTKTMQEIQDLQGKNTLREQILSATSRIIGTNKVSKVYFTDFVVQ